MGKILKGVQSVTQKAADALVSTKKASDFGSSIGSSLQKGHTIAGKAVLLTLSKAWIGIGILKPATTEGVSVEGVTAGVYAKNNYKKGQESKTPYIEHFFTSKMWSIKFGDYFMPLSQTYTVRAVKELNISSLVDGIDIIQQTRKQAKTIDCTLKISINENQANLQIHRMDPDALATVEISTLKRFLSELYEKDVVFKVENATINHVLNVEYVIMSSYRFLPRSGSKIYIFEFSLTEVKFGDNVLTFDETQIQAPVE